MASFGPAPKAPKAKPLAHARPAWDTRGEMQTSAAAHHFPSPALFTRTAHLLTASRLPVDKKVDQKKITAFRKHVRTLTKLLRSLSKIRIEYLPPTDDLAAEDVQAVRLVLEALRSASSVFEGETTRRLERAALHFTPALGPAFHRAAEAAREQLRELRATLAFMIEEPNGDDERLGYELVPPAPPQGRPSGPSVAVDLD